MREKERDPNINFNKSISKELSKFAIKVKKLQYKMDFGSTEVIIKMGLN